MIANFRYGKEIIKLSLPENSIEYCSDFKNSGFSVLEMLHNALSNPTGCENLKSLLLKSNQEKVVIVVSDITRPIPYYQFLPSLLTFIEESGIQRNKIIILIATGMHRPSTKAEHLEMFGEYVVTNYTIIDHKAENSNMLVEVAGLSKSGRKVHMNRYYVNGGFKIVTGLVEPHFMAGFSGGRKAICPGLVSLDAVQVFHGFKFLNSPYARNVNLKENPCHEESLSIASLVPPDFTINVILDNEKKINNITAGDLTLSHNKAIELVKQACCPLVSQKADVIITSCGGHPLDTTFYQCVKAFVTCLPAVKPGGKIIALGGCTQGTGSSEYTQTMLKYSGKHEEFIKDIKVKENFTKDQWQFQMHCRTIEHVGIENLYFFTKGIENDHLKKLSVNPLPYKDNDAENIQEMIDQFALEGKVIGYIPEGPYCAPVDQI